MVNKNITEEKKENKVKAWLNNWVSSGNENKVKTFTMNWVADSEQNK